ncbi:MAG: SDR family oxidoreductase [Hyphomicrobiaceae bacterium]|nr:SDR family oxidoreductase [Hyphomicrobiaceae bacterium]
MSPKPLAGKVALVTGAGRNIGRAVALALAGDGASVVVNARSNKWEADAVVNTIEAAGGKALAALGDVASPEAVALVVAKAKATFGRIDILVCNAALRRELPFRRMALSDWREVMTTSLDSLFICAKAALPHLEANGWGRIVNIGGLSAHTGAKDRLHVVTAKLGLVGFTRGLAHDLAGTGITVNCVVPGMIETLRPISRPTPAHHGFARTLTGRGGRCEEVAAAVCYLCGPGSDYVTGQTLHVNGGAYLG